MISVNISMNPVSPPQPNGRRDAMMEVDMGGPCLLIHSDHHLLGLSRAPGGTLTLQMIYTRPKQCSLHDESQSRF